MSAGLLIAAGIGAKVAGTIQEGRIAERQGEVTAKIAQRNQQALERQAKAEKEASNIEEARIARKSKLVQARLRVGAAKSGLGVKGATLDALADAAFQFSMDRNLTRRRGLIKSRELIQRGGIIRAEGQFAKSLGKAKKRLSYIKAAGQGIGGASSAGLI